MRADTEQINERLNGFRDVLLESPHSGILVLALDAITQPKDDEPFDSPSIKLARYMLGGNLELAHGTAALRSEPLIIADPDLAMHAIRQVGAARLVLPHVLEEFAEQGEPYASLHLPTICRSQAGNDTALLFIDPMHRQAVWRDGPKPHPYSHQLYKSHPLLGLRLAAQHGNMLDTSSRNIAFSAARHHARQRPETSYGVRWHVIDRYLHSLNAPETDELERDRIRLATNIMRPFDALDDLLTRVQRCEVSRASERGAHLMENYLEAVDQMTARRKTELGGISDQIELELLSKVIKELSRQLSSAGPLADMYQDVWDTTRHAAALAA